MRMTHEIKSRLEKPFVAGRPPQARVVEVQEEEAEEEELLLQQSG